MTTQNDVYLDLMVKAGEKCCPVDSEPDGWCCTRAAGHKGPHMAGNGTTVVYEWSDNAGLQRYTDRAATHSTDTHDKAVAVR